MGKQSSIPPEATLARSVLCSDVTQHRGCGMSLWKFKMTYRAPLTFLEVKVFLIDSKVRVTFVMRKEMQMQPLQNRRRFVQERRVNPVPFLPIFKIRERWDSDGRERIGRPAGMRRGERGGVMISLTFWRVILWRS